MAPRRGTLKGFAYTSAFSLVFNTKKGRRKKGAVRLEVTSEETFRSNLSKGEPKVFDPRVRIEELRPGDSIEVYFSIEDGNSAALTQKAVTIKLLPPEPG